MSTLVDQLNGALSDAMESVRDALVQVQVPGRGGGAGIVWRDDGLIVTNAHVAGRGPTEVVLHDGRRLQTRLVARSRKLDLAALAVESPGLHAAPIGDSMALRAGELVFALGHPFGVAGAVTSGVVIGLEPDAPPLATVAAVSGSFGYALLVGRTRNDGLYVWMLVGASLVLAAGVAALALGARAAVVVFFCSVYVTQNSGGHGAIREAVEWLLCLRNEKDQAYAAVIG